MQARAVLVPVLNTHQAAVCTSVELKLLLQFPGPKDCQHVRSDPGVPPAALSHGAPLHRAGCRPGCGRGRVSVRHPEWRMKGEILTEFPVRLLMCIARPQNFTTAGTQEKHSCLDGTRGAWRGKGIRGSMNDLVFTALRIEPRASSHTVGVHRGSSLKSLKMTLF